MDTVCSIFERDTLFKKGFIFVDGSDIEQLVDADAQALKEFSGFWDNLGKDEYLQGNYTFRYRRYGQIGFIPGKRHIFKRKDSAYYQSSEINSYAGGISRVFAPLTEEIVNNRVFKSIIFDSFFAFNIEDEYLESEWFADIHLFRLVVDDDLETSPTPEGIHRDGFPFGALHLVGRENIEGGVTRIYSMNDELLGIRTLENPFDSFYCFDNRVKHFTSPLLAKEGGHGYRDVLVYGFHLPETKYQQG